ncbi:MAG: hypothetical protein ACRCY9_10180, partial [Phycicoccus sp.]
MDQAFIAPQARGLATDHDTWKEALGGPRQVDLAAADPGRQVAQVLAGRVRPGDVGPELAITPQLARWMDGLYPDVARRGLATLLPIWPGLDLVAREHDRPDSPELIRIRADLPAGDPAPVFAPTLPATLLSTAGAATFAAATAGAPILAGALTIGALAGVGALGRRAFGRPPKAVRSRAAVQGATSAVGFLGGFGAGVIGAGVAIGAGPLLLPIGVVLGTLAGIGFSGVFNGLSNRDAEARDNWVKAADELPRPDPRGGSEVSIPAGGGYGGPLGDPPPAPWAQHPGGASSQQQSTSVQPDLWDDELYGRLPVVEALKDGGWGSGRVHAIRPRKAQEQAQEQAQAQGTGSDEVAAPSLGGGPSAAIDPLGLAGAVKAALSGDGVRPLVRKDLGPEIIKGLSRLLDLESPANTPDLTKVLSLWNGVDLEVGPEGRRRLARVSLRPEGSGPPRLEEPGRLDMTPFFEASREVPDLAEPGAKEQSWYDHDMKAAATSSHAKTESTTFQPQVVWDIIKDVLGLTGTGNAGNGTTTQHARVTNLNRSAVASARGSGRHVSFEGPARLWITVSPPPAASQVRARPDERDQFGTRHYDTPVTVRYRLPFELTRPAPGQDASGAAVATSVAPVSESSPSGTRVDVPDEQRADFFSATLMAPETASLGGVPRDLAATLARELFGAAALPPDS